jgi:dihydrofolate reductase
MRRRDSMRKLIVIEFMTLDGVIQAPGGPEEDTSGGFEYGGWTVPYFDEAAGNIMNEQMSLEESALLLGRKTYEIFASYWPHHSDNWPGINEARKYVVSHDSSFKSDWNNSVLLTGDVIEQIKKLKSEGDSNLKVWGSGDFVQTLLKHDLVDELWFKIFPVTLGTGKRLFSEGTIPSAFTLTNCEALPTGVIVANYKRSGEVKTGSFEK